jgi:hypothetical protein
MFGLESLMAKALFSGTVIVAVIGFIKKKVPNEKIRDNGYWCGKLISSKGRGKLGKKIWEAVESLLEDTIRPWLNGFWPGLDEDDNKGESP